MAAAHLLFDILFHFAFGFVLQLFASPLICFGLSLFCKVFCAFLVFWLPDVVSSRLALCCLLFSEYYLSVGVRAFSIHLPFPRRFCEQGRHQALRMGNVKDLTKTCEQVGAGLSCTGLAWSCSRFLCRDSSQLCPPEEQRVPRLRTYYFEYSKRL